MHAHFLPLVRRFGAAIFVLLLPATAAAQTCPDPAATTGDLTGPLADVRYLADDGLEGRLAGSDGERCAGDYLADRFDAIGLRPAGGNGTFFQSLPLASVLNPHAPGGTGRNVIAALDGQNPELSDQWIVIGAHYDHLGAGGSMSSLAPGDTSVHNGADDNASGVAAMLEAASRLADGPRPARGVLFVAFTGEESGLLGSAYFAEHPTVDGRLVGMINMDMVGRLGDDVLIVYGVDTAEEWPSLLEPAAEQAEVSIATRGEGYGPSDHTSFYIKDVPVLHFFTNVHGDYHRPGDDWEKIDAAGISRIAGMVVDVVAAAANRQPALTLVRGAGDPPAPAGEVSQGYGAWLGTVPDFTPVDRGVKLSGVTPGSPADAGGVLAGDVVIGISDHDVADLQGMTDALRAHRPGETVEVRLLREDAPVAVEVTLGDRADR